MLEHERHSLGRQGGKFVRQRAILRSKLYWKCIILKKKTEGKNIKNELLHVDFTILGMLRAATFSWLSVALILGMLHAPLRSSSVPRSEFQHAASNTNRTAIQTTSKEIYTVSINLLICAFTFIVARRYTTKAWNARFPIQRTPIGFISTDVTFTQPLI